MLKSDETDYQYSPAQMVREQAERYIEGLTGSLNSPMTFQTFAEGGPSEFGPLALQETRDLHPERLRPAEPDRTHGGTGRGDSPTPWGTGTTGRALLSIFSPSFLSISPGPRSRNQQHGVAAAQDFLDQEKDRERWTCWSARLGAGTP